MDGQRSKMRNKEEHEEAFDRINLASGARVLTMMSLAVASEMNTLALHYGALHRGVFNPKGIYNRSTLINYFTLALELAASKSGLVDN